MPSTIAKVARGMNIKRSDVILDPIVIQHCYPDCKNCNGEGSYLIPAKETGDVDRWKPCENSDAYQQDQHWISQPVSVYGLADVSLEGISGYEIKVPKKPREGQEEMLKLFANIANESKLGPPKTWGLLLGSWGRGKSHYMIGMVNWYRENNRGAHYVPTAGMIISRLQDSFDTNERTQEIRRFYIKVPFLAIDEIEKVKWTEWAGGQLYEILEARRLAGRSTVMASNLTIEQLKAKSELFGALLSRIAGNGRIVAVEGVDHRRAK